MNGEGVRDDTVQKMTRVGVVPSDCDNDSGGGDEGKNEHGANDHNDGDGDQDHDDGHHGTRFNLTHVYGVPG